MVVGRAKWNESFSEWFRSILIDAGIMDYRYPLKGCGVWLPYGFKIRRNILQVMRDLLDSTGHKEALFPLLIPESSLAKEATHIGSFKEECLWVTHGGNTPLRVSCALRPTSETAIAPMLKLWIRSHADLPIKLFQVVNIFRYETKATRPILRMREVSTFKEAHTAHATVEEANAQVETAVGIYKRFFDEIGVPYLISQRPEWDKFAGAERSIAFDMICPDGRSLQIGTVHNLGQNFSKSFDIAYETRDGKREHVWQTCYGVSGRAIAAVLIVHGDDHGLVLPPKLAPIQVVVVPIPSENEKEEIIKQCEEIAKLLRKNDVRVELDLRTDLTPGAKFYYWELRGVLLRVEIGPKEIKRKEVTIVRRDTLEKNAYKKSELVNITRKLIIETTKDLRRRAWQWMNEHIHRVDNLEDVRKVLERRMGVIEVSWCGNADCGSELEEKINARILGIPLNVKEKGEIEKCVCCGRKASHIIRIASAY